jgi:hypothetical protein
MAGVAVLAVISFVGMVASVAWIVCVSLGIRREDRRSTVATLRGMAPGRASRVARQATGCHWV